ncbi:hypothetical protein EVAR_93005_1 [Eumeta japonica]|uniref:Uncharacterized protein n=1 Tax=Eumeta variegata TaxID=151549 RepID=A0A4C1TBK9_EUMVA|nr:hypothetical protein EVAR_93005_1 [Eumeta japonica]
MLVSKHCLFVGIELARSRSAPLHPPASSAGSLHCGKACSVVYCQEQNSHSSDALSQLWKGLRNKMDKGNLISELRNHDRPILMKKCEQNARVNPFDEGQGYAKVFYLRSGSAMSTAQGPDVQAQCHGRPTDELLNQTRALDPRQSAR